MTATLLLAAVLLGQPPAPVPAASIDALIDKVIELRAKKAEIEKAEGATTAELQAKTRALLDRLAQLGVTPQPAPGPQPGPTPPPPPADPFVTELQQLYTADAGPDKAKALAALLELYKQAADLAGSPDAETAGQLLAAVQAAAKKLVPQGSLPALRARLGAELNKLLPTDPTAALTPATRAQVKAAFGKLAAALAQVK